MTVRIRRRLACVDTQEACVYARAVRKGARYTYVVSRSGSAVERDPRAGTGLGVVVHECTRLITAYERRSPGNRPRLHAKLTKGRGGGAGVGGGSEGSRRGGHARANPSRERGAWSPHFTMLPCMLLDLPSRLTPAFELNRNAPAHIHRMVNCRMSSGLRLVITDSACHRRTRRTENPDTSRLWKQVRSVMRYSAAYLTCSPNTSSGVSEGA